MANEVTVIEMQALRGNVEVRPMPPLNTQTLTIGGPASSAFNKSTNIITIMTNTDCNVCFTPLGGADPTGSDYKFPLIAYATYDFSVRPGTKVIAVA